MESLPLAPGTRALVDLELKPGEAERWSSAPSIWIFARRFLGPVIIAPPVALLLAVFVAAAMGSMPENGPLHGFRVWLAAAPAMVALLSWVWVLWKAKSPAYVVTDRRAFVLEPGLFGSPKIRTFATQLGNATLVERADGSGDVLLGMVEMRGAKYSRVKRIVGFFGLPEPQIPFRLIEKLRKEVPQDPISVTPDPLRISSFGVPAFFAIVGLFFSGHGIYFLVKGVASYNWPKANGMVLSSRVIESQGRNGRSYAPEISYEFEVDGRGFRSSRIEYGALVGQLDESRALVELFSPGSHIQVFYDPVDPDSCALRPGFGMNAFLSLALGLNALSFAVYAARTVILNAWPKAAAVEGFRSGVA